MFRKVMTRFQRILIALLALAVIAMALPQPVSAASLGIEIVSVKADESVTVRLRDFPANQTFTARIDKTGNNAIDGIAVADTQSGKGGSFEVTYRIPAELKGTKTLTIRLESDSGYYSFNWFNNKTTQSTGAPVPVTGSKPYIRVVGVKQNDSVMIEALNLAANTNFRVRVGPFYSFYKDYLVVDSINSGSTSPIRFKVKLPADLKDVEKVTIRIDGANGSYAFNAFDNKDSGTVEPTPTPTQPVKNTCEVISVSPNRVAPRADFDAIWTVKNTSEKTWDVAAVDYKYISGSKIHKRGEVYDLAHSVKPGETVKIMVDMLAPGETGTYSANWALTSSGSTLCSLPITVTVR